MNLSQTDSILLAIPFVCMLAVFVFRLDVLIFRSPAKPAATSTRPRFANFNGDEMLMADPDGRVPQPARSQRTPQRRPLLRDSDDRISRSVRQR